MKKEKEEERWAEKEFPTPKARGSQRFLDPFELALTAGTAPFICRVGYLLF